MRRFQLAAVIAVFFMSISEPGFALETTHIVLRVKSPSNFKRLNGAIGKMACITGHLSVDSAGVYFPLQPTHDGGVLNPGFSRITAALPRGGDRALPHLTSGTHTVCGILEDATPFKGCSVNECKWYRLDRPNLKK